MCASREARTFSRSALCLRSRLVGAATEMGLTTDMPGRS